MRVGVAIPSYLGAAFIEPTLRSLTTQSHDDWFAIVVNDGEEDGTADVVAAIGDPRIQYYNDGRRRGQFGNFNCAIMRVLATQPGIVKLLCADDVLYPYALSDVTRVFQSNALVGLVAAHYDGIDSCGRLLFHVNLDGRDDLVMKGRDYLRLGVALGNTIGGPSSVAIRREAIESAGLFDTRINHSGEADLWHRVAVHWDIAWIGRRAGLQYRFHDASITGRGKYSVAKFSDPIQIVRRVAATEPLLGARWWAHQYTIGRLHSINLLLLGSMMAHKRWDGVRAGLTACLREGLILYAPFWVPRIPWQLFQIVRRRNPSERVLWGRWHKRLQPPRDVMHASAPTQVP